MTKPSNSSGYKPQKSVPALELHSRAAPSVEAHHRVNSPNTGRNSGGGQIIIIKENIALVFVINFDVFMRLIKMTESR